MKALQVIFVLLFTLAGANVTVRAQTIRTVPDSVATTLKNDKHFRYANDPRFWQKRKPADNSAWLRLMIFLSRSVVVRWIFYALAAAMVIFVVIKVIQVNDFFDVGRKKDRNSRAGEEQLIPDDLDALLDSAIRNGDLRLAIRLYYLQTLRRLEEIQKITLQPKFTNHDYLLQMNAQPEAGAFRWLTDIYEYVWYGEFQPSSAQFQTIQRSFNKFNSSGW